MNIIIVGAAVAIVTFILYALDRRSKGESIDYATAGKLTLFSGILSSGITFVATAEAPEIIESVKAVGDVAQDMFVGKPTF